MKRTTMILFTVLLLAGQANVSFARLGRVTMTLYPCGGGTLCNNPGYVVGAGGNGSMSCETASWGNDEQGGTETVCAGDNGSSSWETEEWGPGYRITDSGGATMNNDGSVTTMSTSTDVSTSGSSSPKFSSPYSGYAR